MIQRGKRAQLDLPPPNVWRNKVNHRKRAKTKEEWRPEKTEWIPEEERYKRFGSSEMFSDSSMEASFPWDTKISPYVLSSADEGTRVKSLKHLCAMRIAENEDLLNLQLLRSGSWATWSVVWDYIVSWRRDSFLMFQLFAGAFAHEAAFSCHPKFENCSEPKKKVILTSMLPNARNHRVERLFGNVKISQFVESLNYAVFNNLVFLNLNKPVDNDDVLSLTNLSRLLALRISRINTITDSTILTWCSSLKSNKWAYLQILSLPEISQDSMIKLQQTARHCRLTYIEVQSKVKFNMEKEWDRVDYNNWELISDRAFNNLPWGLKSMSILRKYTMKDRTYLPNGLIYLDFNILNHTYNERLYDRQQEYDHLWNMTELQTYHQGLIMKKNLAPLAQKAPLQKHTIKKSIVKSKSMKVKSLKSFFDLK